jgi:bacillithiol biosynthesis deacetylase BshB1
MNLDILVLAAHPDDAELGCSGTIAAHVAMVKKVGIIDFTRGEMGTRGTPETRDQEAAEASKILKISVRENLRFKDVFFTNDLEHQLKVVQVIRKYRPKIVLCNAPHDRHPDHGKGSALASQACFLAGLRKVETFDKEGLAQEAWRPEAVYHYIQDRYLQPDFVVDITPYWETKVASIRAYQTQFFNPNSSEPQTYISRPDFLNFVEARSREMGHPVGFTFAEGFLKERHIGVRNLFDLV